MIPENLAGILKNFYNSFSMNTFTNRLKIQKIIYLMQAYGLNIGYLYSYYLYGPYSTDLTKDAYSMPDFNKISKMSFSGKEDSNKFEQFINFIGKRKNDVFWLEVCSSIHLLYNQGYSKKQIINFIKNKHNDKYIEKEEEISLIYNEIKQRGLI
jgi:uncharacterized protein YwgA